MSEDAHSEILQGDRTPGNASIVSPGAVAEASVSGQKDSPRITKQNHKFGVLWQLLIQLMRLEEAWLVRLKFIQVLPAELRRMKPGHNFIDVIERHVPFGP